MLEWWGDDLLHLARALLAQLAGFFFLPRVARACQALPGAFSRRRTAASEAALP